MNHWFTAAVAASAFPVAAGVQVELINDDFSNSEAYVESEASDGPGAPFDSFFFELNYESTGGNPGDFATIVHEYTSLTASELDDEGITPDDLDTIVFYDFELASYDPSVSGPISSVSFSLDVNNPDVDLELFFFVATDTTTVSSSRFEFFPVTDGFETTLEPNADFGSFDLNANGPLTFGFAFQTFVEDFRDDPGSDFDGEVFSFGVDNFVVTLDVIPEPGSLALIALGGLAMLRRDR